MKIFGFIFLDLHFIPICSVWKIPLENYLMQWFTAAVNARIVEICATVLLFYGNKINQIWIQNYHFYRLICVNFQHPAQKLFFFFKLQPEINLMKEIYGNDANFIGPYDEYQVVEHFKIIFTIIYFIPRCGKLVTYQSSRLFFSIV